MSMAERAGSLRMTMRRPFRSSKTTSPAATSSRMRNQSRLAWDAVTRFICTMYNSTLRPSSAGLPVRPLTHDSGHLHEDVLRAAPGALEGPVGVVGGLEEVERGAISELLHHRAQELEVRQVVTRPAEEEQGDGDPAEVLRAPRVRLLRLMEGKGEEHQAFHSLEGSFRGRGGGHAAAEGVPPGQERQGGGGPPSRRDRRPDGRRAHLGGAAPASALAAGKVIAERRQALLGEPVGDGLEGGVAHVGAGAVAEDEEVAGALRLDQKRGDLALLGSGDELQLLHVTSCRETPPPAARRGPGASPA